MSVSLLTVFCCNQWSSWTHTCSRSQSIHASIDNDKHAKALRWGGTASSLKVLVFFILQFIYSLYILLDHQCSIPRLVFMIGKPFLPFPAGHLLGSLKRMEFSHSNNGFVPFCNISSSFAVCWLLERCVSFYLYILFRHKPLLSITDILYSFDESACHNNALQFTCKHCILSHFIHRYYIYNIFAAWDNCGQFVIVHIAWLLTSFVMFYIWSCLYKQSDLCCSVVLVIWETEYFFNI